MKPTQDLQAYLDMLRTGDDIPHDYTVTKNQHIRVHPKRLKHPVRIKMRSGAKEVPFLQPT